MSCEISAVAQPPAPALTFADAVGLEFAAACRIVDEAFTMPTFGEAIRFVSIMKRSSERMPDLVDFALLSRMRAIVGMPL